MQIEPLFFLKKGERARVHFASRRIGQKTWSTIDFKVVRLSDNKIIDIGHQNLTETGELALEDQ